MHISQFGHDQGTCMQSHTYTYIARYILDEHSNSYIASVYLCNTNAECIFVLLGHILLLKVVVHGLLNIYGIR